MAEFSNPSIIIPFIKSFITSSIFTESIFTFTSCRKRGVRSSIIEAGAMACCFSSGTGAKEVVTEQ